MSRDGENRVAGGEEGGACWVMGRLVQAEYRDAGALGAELEWLG